MKTVVLELVDEKGQPVLKVPVDDYAVPAAGEAVEEMDNNTIVARAEELISAVLRLIQELKAEPAETPIKVRISISEALLLAGESEASEIAIILRVRPTHEE